MKLTGAEIVAEVLLEQDVDTVFGYPGGAALNIYDALYKYSGRIRHVLFAHEQGASHAADGYARATDKTGVVIATSGPGATNLVTGIATAFMDSIPMVAITSNVPSSLIGRDSFQEVCITGVTMPVTKHNFFVNKIEDLASSLRDAFKIAGSGRKGPVLVDITKDVSAALYDYKRETKVIIPELPKINPCEAEEIAGLINKSKRPVLYIGGGAKEAYDELSMFLDKVHIPSAYTIMAAGIIAPNREENLGLIGMHGQLVANKAVQEADLVISLGARYSDRVALNSDKFAKKAVIIQIDIDKSEFSKNVSTNLSVRSDVKSFLKAITPRLNENSYNQWLEALNSWKKEYGFLAHQSPKASINPKELMEAISSLREEDYLYVTDVGQHQMWSAQYLTHSKPKSFLTSGGLGTMGYGYGAAIGAKIGCPQKRVIHITGDGSFHMNLNECCTAVSYNLPIITVILNNRVLGMVYQWQNAFYNGRLSQTTPGRKTDFVKLAEGFGAKGFRADNIMEFKEAFKEALKDKGPVWIECTINPDEKVLPMIPNGGTVQEAIID